MRRGQLCKADTRPRLGHLPLESSSRPRWWRSWGWYWRTASSMKSPTALRSLQALVMAEDDNRRCTSGQFDMYLRGTAARHAGTRRQRRGPHCAQRRQVDTFQHVCQYEVGAGRSLPVDYWAVVARVFKVTVTVWELQERGQAATWCIGCSATRSYLRRRKLVVRRRRAAGTWTSRGVRSRTLPRGCRHQGGASDGPEGNHFMLLHPEGRPAMHVHRRLYPEPSTQGLVNGGAGQALRAPPSPGRRRSL